MKANKARGAVKHNGTSFHASAEAMLGKSGRGNNNKWDSESFRVYRMRNGEWSFDHEYTTGPDEQKRAALRYIMEAWHLALHDGIEPEMLANASFFAALSDLVTTYGEDAVAKMTDGLSRRVHNGEFTLYRVTQ